MKKQSGFTLVEIMIVVAIIGLLAAIAIPSFMKARTTSQAKACVNNLRQIESGKEQWALAAGLSNGTPASTVAAMSNVNAYIKLQGTNVPGCPASGTYDYTNVGVNATCTISSNRNVDDEAAWHLLK